MNDLAFEFARRGKTFAPRVITNSQRTLISARFNNRALIRSTFLLEARATWGFLPHVALESESGRIAAFSRPAFFQIARLTNYQT
jgi:hypothetical protein